MSVPGTASQKGRDDPMALKLDTIDLTRIEVTNEDLLRVRQCVIPNDPDKSYLRARRMALRIKNPETLVRRLRAAVSEEDDASALAFLYALCSQVDATPQAIAQAFGGSHLVEDWIEEETFNRYVLRNGSRKAGPKEGMKLRFALQECILMTTVLAKALRGRKEQRVARELFNRLTDLLA
jgi:hypothetical protein